ncbi:MAG: hypothetical protein LUE29_09135, partial [Lachnospiraceae bacterium]|nr:hypothetical protein [Lachnospiraceae bacterium]
AMEEQAFQFGSGSPATDEHTLQPGKNNTQWILGMIACIGGMICLIIWGIVSIFNPSVSNQLSESSMISIDGNGVFLILCIAAIVAGAVLLLKGSHKKR